MHGGCMINIAVCGANGKMGQEVIRAVKEAEDMTLVAKIDINNGEFATIKDAKESVNIDILIDFTQPKSIYENAVFTSLYPSNFRSISSFLKNGK